MLYWAGLSYQQNLNIILPINPVHQYFISALLSSASVQMQNNYWKNSSEKSKFRDKQTDVYKTQRVEIISSDREKSNEVSD